MNNFIQIYKMTNKIDEKQKAVFLEKIYADHPEIKGDKLKSYCVEKLLETYLLDPKSFVDKTNELMKKEKKKLKKGEDTVEKKNDEPKEIIAISKLVSDEPSQQTLTLGDDGMIKPS
jgi:hypothetical protein